jgi:hypothetical protein
MLVFRQSLDAQSGDAASVCSGNLCSDRAIPSNTYDLHAASQSHSSAITIYS